MLWTYTKFAQELLAILALKVLASCARVSQGWSSTFTPPLYNSMLFGRSMAVWLRPGIGREKKASYTTPFDLGFCL